MNISTKAGATALAATLALGLPGAAMADRGERGDRGVPSRVATKLKAADRALDRAQERADDGESAGAATALASVRKNLASALKSAQRRITPTGGRAGKASAGAVARTDHHVVAGTASMFDGADATVTDASASTLDAAIDNRDAVIAAIAALSGDALERYERVLHRIEKAVDDEIEAITEALEDDTLTPEGRAALEAALTKLAATKAAAGGTDGDDTGYAQQVAAEAEADDYGDRRRGRRGDCPDRDSGSESGTGYEDQTTSGDYDRT